MAISIVIKDDNGRQVKNITLDPCQDEKRWEEVSYQVGCEVARQVAVLLIERIEERILHQRPKTLKVKDSKDRTHVTRFGDVTVSRRLYKDDKGVSRFLLDEYLDWPPYRVATPSLSEALVELSTQCSFQRVSTTLEKLTGGVLSKSTIHRLLGDVSDAFIQADKHTWESCFGEGRLPPGGIKQAPLLFVEADSIYVRLQREKQKRYELKNSIAYEGWERLNQTEERYRLVNKRVYCHSDRSIPFWDGASLVWDRYWNMSSVNLIVLGGDDADWINKGVEEIPYCIRQMDGFHIARSCRRGWEQGGDMYDAIRTGRIRHTLGVTVQKEGKTAQKERTHVLKCLDRGIDWRMQVKGMPLDIPEGVRGLGTMESNEDKFFADRMKKKGLSWTIAGAQRMGKAIQMVANDELRDWCGRLDQKKPSLGKDTLCFDVFTYPPEYENSASVPALVGPHSSRPWVMALRDLVSRPYPLN